MDRYIAVIIVLVLAGVGMGTPGDNLSAQKDTANGGEYIARAVAISQAVKYAGFRSQEFSESKGNIQAVFDSSAAAVCPLVRNKKYGSAVWRVELRDVAFLPEYNKRPWPPQRIRNFTFWIDAATGKLLRVYSGLPDTLISSVERKPYYVYYEKMKGERGESDSNVIYHDFPDSLHKMTFCDVVANSASQPFDKGEITAYYVTTTWYSKESRPLWIIDVGGVPPTLKGGSHSDWSINHMEKLFDARVGYGGMVIDIFYTAEEWWQNESLIDVGKQ